MAERLTDRGIAALEAPAKSTLIFDTAVTGLALRLLPTGKKTFVFDYRDAYGRQRRVALGSPPSWTIGKARLHASRLRLRVDVGEEVTQRRGSNIAVLIDEWLATVRLTRKPRTVAHYKRLLTRHVVPQFGKVEPKALTRDAIESWHGTLAARVPVEANRALMAFAAFMTWAERNQLVARNVCRGIKRKPESPRSTYLSATEIEQAYAALDAAPVRNAALALKLSLATGARIGECLALTRAQLDVANKIWIKPAHTVKQARTHITPLSDLALATALELAALPAPSYAACRRAWRRVKRSLNRNDIRIHDLRHSRASALARAGASLPMIGKLLGHSQAQTTQRYAHLTHADLAALVERVK